MDDQIVLLELQSVCLKLWTEDFGVSVTNLSL